MDRPPGRVVHSDHLEGVELEVRHWGKAELERRAHQIVQSLRDLQEARRGLTETTNRLVIEYLEVTGELESRS